MQQLKQETPPVLFPPLPPVVPPHLLYPMGRAWTSSVALRVGSGTRRSSAPGKRALSAQMCQAACLAALIASSWRYVAFRTVKKEEARLRCLWVACQAEGGKGGCLLLIPCLYNGQESDPCSISYRNSYNLTLKHAKELPRFAEW